MYFNHLWHWAGELAKASSKKSSSVDLSSLHTALLNMKPEGQLQREARDIIEELGIMIQIVKKQLRVLKQFKRNAEKLMSQRLKQSSGDSIRDQISTKGEKPSDTFAIHADEFLNEMAERLEELVDLHHKAEDECKDVSIPNSYIHCLRVTNMV